MCVIFSLCRHSLKCQYSALDSGSSATERCPRERSVRDHSFNACQEWLKQLNGRYEIIAHLDDIGSRSPKNWFLLSDSTVRRVGEEFKSYFLENPFFEITDKNGTSDDFTANSGRLCGSRWASSLGMPKGSAYGAAGFASASLHISRVGSWLSVNKWFTLCVFSNAI